MTISEQITRIPKWRCLLRCLLLRRKQWKLARAYNAVACDLMNHADWELGDNVRKHGETKWAIVYGLDAPKVETEQWQSRALMAESNLDLERRLRDLRERELALVKRTAIGLATLKRQRRMPLA